MAAPAEKPSRTRLLLICLGLLLAVVAVFGQTCGYDFVNYDDGEYVFDNAHMVDGLTMHQAAWAVSTFHGAYWIPMTWLSLLLDAEFYKLNPGGYHLTNLLLHAATAVMLFLALRRMTDAVWPSAWAAAVFAIHPLRVESVAWVTERKDVLSGFFFMATLWFYACYVERPGSWRSYLLALTSFALGLMAKPMIVTLPFVLLLLDFWPLQRFTRSKTAFNSETAGSLSKRSLWLRLIIEKAPFFVLAVASSLVTMGAQRVAMASLEVHPFSTRLGNAAISYFAYIAKIVIPTDMQVIYPLPREGAPLSEEIAAVVALLAISAGAFICRRRFPYLFVGWFWYLGMLVPVIGLVQVGLQRMADRFTYLPQIGLNIAVAWSAAHFLSYRPDRRWVAIVSAAAVIGVLMLIAYRQTQHWRNGESLWNHAIECDPDNWIAQTNLGNYYLSKKQYGKAIAHCRQALTANPNYVDGYINFGNVLLEMHRVEEALVCFKHALDLDPNSVEAQYNYVSALALASKDDEAMQHFQAALKLRPQNAKAYYNFGLFLANRGELDEAIANFRKAIELKPSLAEAHNNLGNALAKQEQFDQAIPYFRQAIELDPDLIEAYYNLGLTYSRVGKTDDAVDQFQTLLRNDPNHSQAHFNLGLALMKTGRSHDALGHYQKALDIAAAHNDQAAVDFLRAEINKLNQR